MPGGDQNGTRDIVIAGRGGIVARQRLARCIPEAGGIGEPGQFGLADHRGQVREPFQTVAPRHQPRLSRARARMVSENRIAAATAR